MGKRIQVRCVRIDNFRHHRKLKLGASYFGIKNDNSWSICDLDGSFIGYYHVYQFMDISEWREDVINTIFDEKN